MFAESARQYGGEAVRRLVIFLFTLLTLFFIFRDGGSLGEKLQALSDRAIGVRGQRIARHMVAAVHGTVNGLVLVGLAEGVPARGRLCRGRPSLPGLGRRNDRGSWR